MKDRTPDCLFVYIDFPFDLKKIFGKNILVANDERADLTDRTDTANCHKLGKFYANENSA